MAVTCPPTCGSVGTLLTCTGPHELTCALSGTAGGLRWPLLRNLRSRMRCAFGTPCCPTPPAAPTACCACALPCCCMCGRTCCR